MPRGGEVCVWVARTGMARSILWLRWSFVSAVSFVAADSLAAGLVCACMGLARRVSVLGGLGVSVGRRALRRDVTQICHRSLYNE